MTYTSGSPTPSAQAKLANTKWRRLNSWWIFAPILGFGFFGFIGFLVAAIRTGKRHYWIATSVYAFLGALAFTLILLAGEDETAPRYVLLDIGMIPFLVALIGPIIHAAILNRDYLTTLAHKGAWYAQPAPHPSPQSPTPEPTSFMGVTNSDYFAAGPAATDPYTTPPSTAQPQGHGQRQHPSPQPHPGVPPARPTPAAAPGAARPIDINHATAEELSRDLNIDATLANHVVAVRGTHGPFRNIDDLATSTNMQPHQLIRFRNKVTFQTPNTQQNPPFGPTGRILDY